MTLHSLQRSLKGFDIREEVQQSIAATSDDIKILNQGQLSLGKDKYSKRIGNQLSNSYRYSLWWGDHRRELGLQTKYFDLKVTGAFWESIHVRNIKEDTFEIASSDDRYPELEEMFTKNILGLNKESRTEEYIPLSFYPELRRRIESKTDLKLS